jgi:chromosomal replication initiation ATPase DnaA
MKLNGHSTARERQLRDDALRRRDADRVIRRIARDHGVTYADIMKKEIGSKAVSNARHHAMAVIKWSTTWSLPEIARLFHRQHHTTVLSAVRKWEGVLNAEHGVKMVEAADSTPDVEAVPTHDAPALEAVA